MCFTATVGTPGGFSSSAFIDMNASQSDWSCRIRLASVDLFVCFVFSIELQYLSQLRANPPRRPSKFLAQVRARSVGVGSPDARRRNLFRLIVRFLRTFILPK